MVAVVGVGRRLLGSVGRLSSSEMPLMHLSFSSALSLSLSLSLSLGVSPLSLLHPDPPSGSYGSLGRWPTRPLGKYLSRDITQHGDRWGIHCLGRMNA